MNQPADGDALFGLAELAQLSAALMVVLVIILLAALFLRRLRPVRARTAAKVQVVGSAAVGVKERVVVVQVQSTWLVLGVGGGQVTALHHLPAPEPDPNAAEPTETIGPGFASGDSFATRFKKALKHNAGLQ